MTVDAYLNTAPAQMRPLLKELRAAIVSAAPKAEETISYNIPTYKLKGTLVHFAAFKDHCSFILVNKDLVLSFSEDLNRHKVSGTTIHVTPDNPLPVALVKKIVKARIRQNQNLADLEARAARKASSKLRSA